MRPMRLQTRLYGWKTLPIDPICFRNFQPKILPSKWKAPPVLRYERAVYKERGRKILTNKNSGLVNFVQESRLPFVQIRNGLKLVSKMALKKWNTYFRLQHSVRKNKTTFSDVQLLPEIFLWNDSKMFCSIFFL